jgi:CopG family nickel-responsive transcriptional regulator
MAYQKGNVFAINVASVQDRSSTMQRVTIVLDDELAEEIDGLVARRGYQNRSEAIRDLARSGLREAQEEEQSKGKRVAALSYVYNHHSRDLAKRLTEAFHDHHASTVASMHVHLDHENCLEVSILKGPAKVLRQIGGKVIAERGVQHGRLAMYPVKED